ncbi:MAG: DNA-formamidopyrimidine glycosylase family protein [Ilumatobacteraceae bacterium]
MRTARPLAIPTVTRVVELVVDRVVDSVVRLHGSDASRGRSEASLGAGYDTPVVRSRNKVRSVPEGDTIHRAAAALRTALVGRPTVRFDAPFLYGPRPVLGRVVERVESHGKHLEIVWDDGLVLHSHMRMTGSWHLYRRGERWRKSDDHMRAVIEVPDWVAVCFSAPVVETYREFDVHRHPGFGPLGPDLCTAPDDQIEECVRRLYDHPDGDTTVAEALLDQHIACGVGNVYRSEILWAEGVHPLAPVASLSEDDCRRLIATAARMLRANLRSVRRVTAPEVDGGLAVYGRNGQRCARCGDTVQVRRVGDHARVLYWCPGCQTHASPVPRSPLVTREMDPHPAASKFLSELPWRRDLAG